MIIYANAPLFHTRPISKWLRGALISKPGAINEFAVQIVVGGQNRFLAVNPNGDYEDRPIGTFGGYETFKILGTNLVLGYMFEGTDVAHVIPYLGEL